MLLVPPYAVIAEVFAFPLLLIEAQAQMPVRRNG